MDTAGLGAIRLGLGSGIGLLPKRSRREKAAARAYPGNLERRATAATVTPQMWFDGWPARQGVSPRAGSSPSKGGTTEIRTSFAWTPGAPSLLTRREAAHQQAVGFPAEGQWI